MTARSLIPLIIVAMSFGYFLSHEKGAPTMMASAPKIPHKMEIHGDVRIDDYFWMRERDTKPVLNYLRQENERTLRAMAPVADLEKTLFQEMRSRIKEDDSSVPVFDGGYYYYTRYQAGQEYPVQARKRGSLDAPEQVILDENLEAKGLAYYQVAEALPSPDHRRLGIAVDTVGRRIYTLRFKDLDSGVFLPDKIESVTSNFVWAADSKTVFYAKQDPETLRSYQIYRYELGRPDSATLVYEEKDTTFNVGVDASRDNRRLYMVSAKRDSAEWSWLPADQPMAAWRVFLPRETGHEYSLEDGGDRVYILTNWKAKNFRLMEADFTAQSKDEWREVIAHDPSTLIEDVTVYRSHLVVSERERGLAGLKVIDRATGSSRKVRFDDPAYEVENVDLPDFDTKFLRFNYESLVQPPAVYDEDFSTQKREIKKEREVPGYRKDLYESRRIWARAADGVDVPVSILLKKGTQLNGQNPALVYGYGSYGINNSVHFWSSVFSLVDRGFLYVQPHVRGGQEMGRDWYEKGRLKHKMNTFTDFISATEKLIADGYTSPEHAHIMGGSAGGLLMGAVTNMRPDLFKSVTAQVPFVDVLTTMLDESIPLTTGEYNEWGDPRKREDYFYMKRYSPYDNIEAKAYPHIFALTGYHDSQVQYWEPAKWVAKLREMKTDSNHLLFFTEMEAGHSGASGRFESLKVLAKQFAFILMIEGKWE